MAPPIAEHDVLVRTDLARVTTAQRRELVERLDHWMTTVSTVDGTVVLRMTVRVAGDGPEAAKRARSVVKRTLDNMRVAGRVTGVELL